MARFNPYTHIARGVAPGVLGILSGPGPEYVVDDAGVQVVDDAGNYLITDTLLYYVVDDQANYIVDENGNYLIAAEVDTRPVNPFSDDFSSDFGE